MGQLVIHRGGQDELEESPLRTGKQCSKRKERTRGQEKRWCRRECQAGGRARLTRGGRPEAKKPQPCGSPGDPKMCSKSHFHPEGVELGS